MPVIADAVFDAALNHIKSNTDAVQARTAGSSVIMDEQSGITSGDFGSPGAGSPSGRQIACLTGSAIASHAVSSGGSIAKVALIDSVTDLIVADISGSAVNVGSSDTITIAAFNVVLTDPP